MKKKQKKVAIVIGVLLLIVGILYSSGVFKPTSIIGISKVTFEGEGTSSKKWVIPISIDGTGISQSAAFTTINLYPSNFEIGFDNNYKYEVTKPITINMRITENNCKWTLKEYCKLAPFGYCLSGAYYLADTSITPEKTVNTQFQVKQNENILADKVINALYIQDTTFLSNDNSISVRANGLTEASYSCGSMSGNTILLGSSTATPIIRDQVCVDNQATTIAFITAAACLLPAGGCTLGNFLANYFADKCYSSFYNSYTNIGYVSGKLVATPKFNLGNANFIIYADASKIGDVTYTPPQTCDTSLKMNCQAEITSGSTGSAIAEVTKLDSNPCNVYVKAIPSSLIGVNPLTTPSVGISDKAYFDFTLNYPVGASSDTLQSISFVSCSSNEISQKCSAAQTCNILAKKAGSGQVTCPNGKCDNFETHSTCPNDCSLDVDCSTIINSAKVGDTCKCLSGTNPVYVNNKLTECKSSDTLLWWIIGGIVAILLIAIIAMAASGGKKSGGVF